MSHLTTLEDAKNKRYSVWAGNPDGKSYQRDRCASEIHINHIFGQCMRKNGYGPTGLYCKQHAEQLGYFSKQLDKEIYVVKYSHEISISLFEVLKETKKTYTVNKKTESKLVGQYYHDERIPKGLNVFDNLVDAKLYALGMLAGKITVAEKVIENTRFDIEVIKKLTGEQNE